MLVVHVPVLKYTTHLLPALPNIKTAKAKYSIIRSYSQASHPTLILDLSHKFQSFSTYVQYQKLGELLSTLLKISHLEGDVMHCKHSMYSTVYMLDITEVCH